MLEVNVRNPDNTVNWAAVPNDVMLEIFSYCSIGDRRELLRVNSRFRQLVLKRSPDLIKIYKLVKSLMPPRIDLSESIADNLDIIANKIEFVPVIGTAISIIRSLMGCFCVARWQISKCSNNDPLELAICEMNRDRAERNIFEGYFKAIPFVGIYMNAAHSMNNLSLDKIKAHAVKCLKEMRKYCRWKKQVQARLLPILSTEKREVLTEMLNQIPSKENINNCLRYWIVTNMNDTHRDRHKDLLIVINKIIAFAHIIARELIYLG